MKTMASKAHHFDKRLYEQSICSKAFAHPARIVLLTHLAENGSTPYPELCREIPLARETVSQYLTFLREVTWFKWKKFSPIVITHLTIICAKNLPIRPSHYFKNLYENSKNHRQPPDIELILLGSIFLLLPPLQLKGTPISLSVY